MTGGLHDFSIIVLAGDRGPNDPLARSAGVAGKVLVKIAGKPMLTRVMETVAGVAGSKPVMVVCRDGREFATAADIGLPYRRIEPAEGPARSVVAALEALGDASPVLLVTGDHPLLEAAWLEQFVERARATGADAVVGAVDYALINKRFPGNRRTCYRFSDRTVCGTNLFYFSGLRGSTVAELWRSCEADRKRPWKIVGRLGPLNLLRYLLGRLSLDGAMTALSRRLGIRVSVVLLDHPEAAVDVDSPADLALAAAIIEARDRTAP